MDQLVEIIKVLGTPTREEIHAMNPNYTEFKFPQIKKYPWTRVFNKRMPTDGVDLVGSTLLCWHVCWVKWLERGRRASASVRPAFCRDGVCGLRGYPKP